MKRKLIHPAIVGAFALLLVGAPQAGAAEFHSAAVPNTISGSQSTSHVFTTDAGTVTCKTFTFSGTLSSSTTTAIEVTPTYGSCTAFGFIGVTIHNNGCRATFTRDGSHHVYWCPPGKKVEITAPFCTTTVGPQYVASGVSFANNGGKTDIIATTNISGIEYNECGTIKTNGKYTGTSTLTGSSSVWYE